MPFELPSGKELKNAILKLEAKNQNNNDRVNLITLFKTIANKVSEDKQRTVLAGLIMMSIDLLPADIAARGFKFFFFGYSPVGSTLKDDLYKTVLKVKTRKDIPQKIKESCYKDLYDYVDQDLADEDISYFKDKKEFIAKIKLYNTTEIEDLNIEFIELPEKLSNKKTQPFYQELVKQIHYRCEAGQLDDESYDYGNKKIPKGYVLRYALLLATMITSETQWKLANDEWYKRSAEILRIKHTSQIPAEKKRFYLSKLADYIYENFLYPKDRTKQTNFQNFALSIRKSVDDLMPAVRQENDPHPTIAYVRDKIKDSTGTGLKYFVVSAAAVGAWELAAANPYAWQMTGGIIIRLGRSVGPMNLARLVAVGGMVIPEATMLTLRYAFKEFSEQVADVTGEAFYFVLAGSTDMVNAISEKLWTPEADKEEPWFIVLDQQAKVARQRKLEKTSEVELESKEGEEAELILSRAAPASMKMN